MKDHDVIIIGGGSAGYAAARTAREQGADVAIVDHGPLGGLCILRGCMPSKTLLRSSDVMSLMRRAVEFGLAGENPRADLAAIMDRKDRLIREFADYRIQQLRGFTLYEDDACFLSPHELRVGDRTLTASSFVIATGSVTSQVEIPGLDEAGYLTSDELLNLRQQPTSLIVLGGGAVATEMAQFFCRIGTEVTLIQRSPHLLSCEDEDLALPVETRFRDEGMHLYTGTHLQRISSENGIKTAHFTHGTDQGEEKSASAEMILQALGRRPNVDHLGLEAAGVDVDNGVTVDAQMRTNQPHIFAVGDVNGLYEIVHIAVQQGEVAGFNAVTGGGSNRSCEERLKTLVVFTDPAVATAGLREKECVSRGIPYLAASYPFDDHGKSMCLGETHGHVKLMCDPSTGELIGSHIVGPEAGELIHELLAVMYFKGTVHDLLGIPHYHPTLAEIVTYPAEELAARLGGST